MPEWFQGKELRRRWVLLKKHGLNQLKPHCHGPWYKGYCNLLVCFSNLIKRRPMSRHLLSFYKAKTCLPINWIPKTLKTMGQPFKARVKLSKDCRVRHQHGRLTIVLEHQYGRLDVYVKRSIFQVIKKKKIVIASLPHEALHWLFIFKIV